MGVKKRRGGKVAYIRNDGTSKLDSAAAAPAEPRKAWYEAQDVSNLTEEQIGRINLARYDVWQGAKQYIKETGNMQEPKLTKRQSELFSKAYYSGDYDSLRSSKPETISAVLKAAEYKYYQAQKQLANGNYDVRDDLPSNLRGQRNNFSGFYDARQQAARVVNEIYEIYEPHAKKPREITSTAHKQWQARLNKEIENQFKNRR